MDIKQAIVERRSVKYFDPDHKMSEAEINELMEHAILSPTSFNIQHWRFVQVADEEKRKQIEESAFNQKQITESSLLLILAADLNAWEKQPERYWQNAPKPAQDALLPMIETYYTNHHQAQRDECLRSTGIAAMNIMLMAKGMGYDSCPMVGFNFDEVARIINLPHDHIITMMLTIGKAKQPANVRGGQLPLDEVFFKDNF